VVCDRFGCWALHGSKDDFSIYLQECGEGKEEKHCDNNEFTLLRRIERRRDGVVGAPRSPLLHVLDFSVQI